MRRTGDFLFESLDEAIKVHSEYLSHLIEVRENGGLLLSDDDVPIGIFANTAGLKESHYASFPQKLVAPLIKTGCPLPMTSISFRHLDVFLTVSVSSLQRRFP